MRLPVCLASVVPLSLLVACTSTLGPSPGGYGGSSDDEFNGSDAGPTCAEVEPIQLSVGPPPDLLLVVDKSGSMDDDIGGQHKWTTMRGALSTTLIANDQSINFGLMLYPSDNDCAAGIMNAAIAPASGSLLVSRLNTVFPDGGTPTHTSLQNALTYFQSNPDPTNSRYVLLATDGEPNCGISDSQAISQSIQAITALHSAGIPTFVLGFGNGVNASTLQQMAAAGGQDRYYAANSPAELAAALDEIAGKVSAPCSMTLSETPEDPNKLRVFFDDLEVGRTSQHTNGWDYDAASNTVRMYGTACDELQTGTVAEVKVDYGCYSTEID